MTDHEPFNGEVLMLDVEQIKEDLKILKVSSKMSRTILFALQTASKYDKNKVTYVSFVVSLQKCKLRKFEDVVKIEKFILDRCYQEKNMRIWPPPLFISTIVSLQTIFFVAHGLYLNFTQSVQFSEFISLLDIIPESYHVKNPIYNILYDDPQKMHQLWRYFATVLINTDIPRFLQSVFVELTIGLPLEKEYGSCRVALIYFAGQLSGIFYTTILEDKSYKPDAIPAAYALTSTQLILFLVKWHSKFLLKLRKTIVWFHVVCEGAVILFGRLVYNNHISFLEGIVDKIKRTNAKERLLENLSSKVTTQNHIPKTFKLKDFGIDDIRRFCVPLDYYENSSHTLKLTGALTGILLGLAIFDNKRNSSLKVKQVKILLGFLYIVVLGFSIMWISRAHDSGITADIPINKFENTDGDTSSLVTFLKKEFSVSQDEANIMAVILQLERKFGETLKPSDIIYIKLRTLDWLSYDLEINDN